MLKLFYSFKSIAGSDRDSLYLDGFGVRNQKFFLAPTKSFPSCPPSSLALVAGAPSLPGFPSHKYLYTYRGLFRREVDYLFRRSGSPFSASPLFLCRYKKKRDLRRLKKYTTRRALTGAIARNLFLSGIGRSGTPVRIPTTVYLRSLFSLRPSTPLQGPGLARMLTLSRFVRSRLSLQLSVLRAMNKCHN